jgi:hypothetical protein
VPDASDSHAVAREEQSTITFDADSDEEVRGWPRRMCIRERGSTRSLGLWYPEAQRTARFHPLTDEDIRRYGRVTGHNRRGATATWGTKTTLEVPVSEIVTVNGVHRLQFRPEGPRWSFDVYNLDVRPEWRRPLERTLRGLPLSHLRATGLKSLCFDIRQASTGGRYVSDGGATWLFSEEGLQRRRSGTETEEDASNGRPAIFVAFAALNRPWWRSRGREDTRTLPLGSEAELDQVYEAGGPAAVWFDTLYHEHGHHFQAHMAEPLERGDEVRQLLRGDGGRLWTAYLGAIPYGGNTTSQGEGFAEAYRYLFSGEGIRCAGYHGGEELAQQIEETFAGLGMPTLDSVLEARAAILLHEGGA